MRQNYRSWMERKEIIQAIIAETHTRPLTEFQLTTSEELYYRARSMKAVARLARQSSSFKAYYRLPTAKPFKLVVAISVTTSIAAALVAGYLGWHGQVGQSPSPLVAACMTVAAAAIGWTVAGWNTHRNTVRQNTNAILFARFSQAPFGEALHRFHKEFGWSDGGLVTTSRIMELTKSGDDDKIKAASSAIYILNYYESIASGVINGDLDQRIVGDNVRGLICSYFDKCSPHILASNKKNYRTFENIIKLRTHYRDP